MPESPIESIRDVGTLIKGDYMEILREQKLDLVDRPLIGEKRSKREQELRYEQFRADPLLIASEAAFLAQRFKLPPGLVSRRLVNQMLKNERRRKERA